MESSVAIDIQQVLPHHLQEKALVLISMVYVHVEKKRAQHVIKFLS